MHKLIYSFFYTKIIEIDSFFKYFLSNNLNYLTINKISIVIILNNLDSLENSSVLSTLFLLKFLGISSPKISKVYINKSKKYTIIFKEYLNKHIIFYFFLYFINSYLNLSHLEKKTSVLVKENLQKNNYSFNIKNLQMFNEIAHHFLLWRNDKVYINIFLSKKNIYKFKNFLLNLGFL